MPKKKRKRRVKTVGVRGDARVQLTRNVSETEIEALAHRGLINDYQLIAGRLALQDFVYASGDRASALRDFVDTSGGQGGFSDGVLDALDRLARISKQLKPECLRAWHTVVIHDVPCEKHQLPDLRVALDIASDLYSSLRLDIDMV